MSRWSRFLTVLLSGTTWNQMRGPPPSGSMMQSAPIPSSASGNPRSRRQSSQLSKPAGGGSSSYPKAAAQKRASRSGSVQSITSWYRTAIGLSPLAQQFATSIPTPILSLVLMGPLLGSTADSSTAYATHYAEDANVARDLIGALALVVGATMLGWTTIAARRSSSR